MTKCFDILEYTITRKHRHANKQTNKRRTQHSEMVQPIGVRGSCCGDVVKR